MMTNAVCCTPSPEVAQLLNELGLSIGANEIEFSDLGRAETGYIHHTRVPVAATGYTLLSPSFARGRFPKLSYIGLMAKRPSMDETEVCALANLCGIEVTPPFWGNPGPFTDHVFAVIEKYEMWDFFQRNEHATPGTPFQIDPIGSREQDVNSPVLKMWRAKFKKLPDVRKMMVVAVLALYNDTACKEHWLHRVPKSWDAAEGINVLRYHGALADWAKLYALYPGW